MTKLNYHNNKDVLQLVRNIEGNRDIVENILDLLNANQSITMSPTRCNIYLCRWNGDEIVQIHTKETLYNEYKDTNLFDNIDTVCSALGEYKKEGFNNLMELLNKWEIEKFEMEFKDFYGIHNYFINDNFEITLIKEGQ